MIALIQRVSEARVVVDGEATGAIGAGILALIGVEKGDTESEAKRLLERLLGYRIFPDAEGKMNRSVVDKAGGLLLVPQFTLAADTNKGTRPSFSSAAPPAEGEKPDKKKASADEKKDDKKKDKSSADDKKKDKPSADDKKKAKSGKKKKASGKNGT